MPTDATPGYAEIAARSYETLVGTIAASNERALSYTRALVGIFVRPYASADVRAVVRENVMRSAAAVTLTLDALEANNRAAAEFARATGHIVTTAQEAYLRSLRAAADTGAANLEFVRDTACRLQTPTLPAPHFN